MESLKKESFDINVKYNIEYPENAEYDFNLFDTLFKSIRKGDKYYFKKEFILNYLNKLKNDNNNYLVILQNLEVFKENKIKVDLKRIYDFLKSSYQYRFILENIELFRQNQVEVNLEEIKKYFEVNELEYTLENFEIFKQKEVKIDLLKIYEYLRKLSKYDLVLDNFETFKENQVKVDLKEAYEYLRDGDYDPILNNLKVFKKNNIEVDVREICEHLEVDEIEYILNNFEIFKQNEIEIDLSKIYKKSNYYIILENFEVFKQGGIEIDLLKIYEYFRKYDYSYILNNLEVFIKINFPVQEIYEDLKKENDHRLILDNLESFQKNGIEVNLQEIYEYLKKQNDYNFILKNFQTFKENNFQINLEDLYNSSLEQRQVNFENIRLFYINGIDTNVLLSSYPEIIGQSNLFKTIQDEEMLNLISGKRFEIESLNRKILEVFNEKEVFNKLINFFYFYQLLSSKINFNKYIENDNDNLLLLKLKNNIQELNKNFFEYLKVYLIIAICSELKHQSQVNTNLGYVDMISDSDFILKHYPDQQILSFLKTASFVFNLNGFEDGYGGKPWSLIARAGFDIWSSKKESSILIDQVIDLEHNNGCFFDKDSRVLKNKANFKKFLDFKSNVTSTSEYIKFLESNGANFEDIKVMKELENTYSKFF